MKQREFEDFTGRDIDGDRFDTAPECNGANVLCRGITSFVKGIFCNCDSYSIQDSQNTKIYTFICQGFNRSLSLPKAYTMHFIETFYPVVSFL